MWDYTAFLKSGLKPMAVKKAGKAVIRRVCLTSIKLRTGGGLSAGDPVTVYAACCAQPNTEHPVTKKSHATPFQEEYVGNHLKEK